MYPWPHSGWSDLQTAKGFSDMLLSDLGNAARAGGAKLECLSCSCRLRWITGRLWPRVTDAALLSKSNPIQCEGGHKVVQRLVEGYLCKRVCSKLLNSFKLYSRVHLLRLCVRWGNFSLCLQTTLRRCRPSHVLGSIPIWRMGAHAGHSRGPFSQVLPATSSQQAPSTCPKQQESESLPTLQTMSAKHRI